MNSLGIKLIIVYGTDQQVDDRLTVDWPSNREHRITSPEIMEAIISISGSITCDLMSRISSSNIDSPRTKNETPTGTGNFLLARPLGIMDGINHQQSGKIRRVNTEAVNYQLNGGSIVLMPTIGYSPSGEIFHLETTITASQVAQSLGADKLIYLTRDEGLRNTCGEIISELDLSNPLDDNLAPGNELLIKCCDMACQAGIARCHVVSYETDGALLEELFTRDGCGTQIVGHSYERIRAATIDDVPGILKLIEPLENEGTLAKRSRELLESEIEQFVVIERDGLLIGCAALYAFEQSGEVACLVVHPDYRNSDRADRLLSNIETKARKTDINQLFVLTTQTLHWFTERDFKECNIEKLPKAKREFYNYQRNSRALYRMIN